MEDATGKPYGGPVRPFIGEDGEEFTIEEAVSDAELSVEELERRLKQARDFISKAKAGTAIAGDEYLSFRYVFPHGYDRTGPSFVMVKEEDE